MTPGTALYSALWPYVADLTVDRRLPDVKSATYADVERIYGRGSAARKAMADALGLSTGREGSPERRRRQSFLEAARRWESGKVSNPSAARGYWRDLVNAARKEQAKRRRADRRTQLDTLSSMVADAGLLIRRVSANIRISNDDRRRDINLTGRHDDQGDDDEPDEGPGGLYLSPDELEAGYGAGGEDFYTALERDDWETAAVVVLSAFMDKYTEGDTGGYPAIVDDVDLLEVEIP